jgi:SagB-type dehydrogenase family enzyme
MRWPVIVLVVALAGGCGTDERGASETSEPVAKTQIDLPEPSPSGRVLEDVLAQRRSVRNYTNEPIRQSDLSTLLWAAQGVTSPEGARTAPSAGALYPLEIYVAGADGVFRYVPDGHRLEEHVRADVRAALSDAALAQEAVARAPIVVVIAAVYARTEQKYGERAERYVELEAGHAAQNLLLEAVALGLGAVPIGAFRDAEVQQVLGLPGDREPLYLIPVGHPPA